MNNQYCDEYLRTALGIEKNYNNPYIDYNRNEYFNNTQTITNTYGMSKEQLESCFPQIYNIINPLVVKTWNINVKPVTNELIEQITEQIYDTVADHDKTIRVNINLTNNVRGEENSNKTEKRDEKADVRHTTEDVETNYLLKDLIRILLIKNLLERQPSPQFGRPPMYPPFPGGPDLRPPVSPRPPIGM